MTPPGTLPHVLTPGAALDRIALLEVKGVLLRRPENRHWAATEQALLRTAWREAGLPPPQSLRTYPEVSRIHHLLWTLENAARDAERRGDLGPDLVDLVGRIHRLNADRAAMRRAVDSVSRTDHGIQLLNTPSGYDSYADQIAIGEVRGNRHPEADPAHHRVLRDLWLTHGLPDIFTGGTFHRLRLANDRLWSVKDRLDAGPAAGRPSVWACRSLYLVNDVRVRMKRHIAVTLGSALRNVKEYVRYRLPQGWDGDALTWREGEQSG